MANIVSNNEILAAITIKPVLIFTDAYMRQQRLYMKEEVTESKRLINFVGAAVVLLASSLKISNFMKTHP